GPREAQGPREPRERRESQGPRELRGDARDARDARPEPAREARAYEAPTPRLEQRRPIPDDADADAAPDAPAEAWGTDHDGPPPEVTLAADLPADAPEGDEDPLTYPLRDGPGAAPGDDVVSVAGVRFAPGGRVTWFDAGEADYAVGERVLVDGERGQRLGWIAVPPVRRMGRPGAGDDRRARRVLRRANDRDLRAEHEGEADRARALRIAKDRAAALRLPLKVFRVEVLGQLGRGARLNVYYTSDERLDLRELIRDLGTALGARIELRQLGVRDEAKAVGGIGSCGLTLCCTTWLPDFVPVSIKMAKDQGLVLSPTKVSGQCGRLKCCLVYEQAGYAELRKGLPKLGKRVIGARGEGRVVEVDVLRQRVRISYGPGDTEVVPAAEVRPLFPSGNQPPARGDAEARDGRAPIEPVEPDEPDDVEEQDEPDEPTAAEIESAVGGGELSAADEHAAAIARANAMDDLAEEEFDSPRALVDAIVDYDDKSDP
ncbi:MAG TPA: regulatory iron-sulfur-containing complex subunit RicT, partial [Kofleriaceae bacterium]|nr:regulatory iron-sulfur-containing complex subunit RicT [Kofleriaceae bacterium]